MMPALYGGLTGLAFGVVLYKVGASRFSRVIGMLTLRDTKVMKFAFTAIATASTLYGLAAVLGLAEPLHLVPRVMPFLGSAHILGGVIFGVAMGTSGMCPGTCVAKTGGGAGATKFAGTAAIAGLVLGILVYSVVKTPLTDAGIIAVNQKPITLHGLLGLPYGVVALIWGAAFFIIALIVDRFTPEKTFEPASKPKGLIGAIRSEWSWLASGIAGGTVIVAATAQNGFVGFSGAMLALVGMASHAIGNPMELVPKLTDEIIWRGMLMVGILPGGLIARWFSIKSQAAVTTPLRKQWNAKRLLRAFLGGTGLSLGAMIGGGCTTGAFIAAWPTLSVGSLAMGGTFFVASMATSNALMAMRKLDFQAAQTLGDQVYD